MVGFSKFLHWLLMLMITQLNPRLDVAGSFHHHFQHIAPYIMMNPGYPANDVFFTCAYCLAGYEVFQTLVCTHLQWQLNQLKYLYNLLLYLSVGCSRFSQLLLGVMKRMTHATFSRFISTTLETSDDIGITDPLRYPEKTQDNFAFGKKTPCLMFDYPLVV